MLTTAFHEIPVPPTPHAAVPFTEPKLSVPVTMDTEVIGVSVSVGPYVEEHGVLMY